MQYTSFVCGILYERFSPGGMMTSRIGVRSGIGGEGDYLIHITQKRARIPYATNGQPATICMTSAEDVGEFVAAAIGLQNWPLELRMRGDRMNISRLVHIAEAIRGASPKLHISCLRLIWCRYSLREEPVQQPKHAVRTRTRSSLTSHTTAAAGDLFDRYRQWTLRLRHRKSQYNGQCDPEALPDLAARGMGRSLNNDVMRTLRRRSPTAVLTRILGC